MEGKMKGYAITGKMQAEWLDFDIPKATPDAVVIKTEIVSICSTDTHLLEQGCETLPYLLGKATGHEMVGTVAEVGENVKTLKPGDRVVVGSSIPDWRSLEAQDGWSNIATQDLYQGFDPGPAHQGVCADYYYVDDADANVAKIPDGVTFEQAVMLSDMVTTGFRCIDTLNIQFGQSVAVMGVGPVGLFAVAGAVLKGAGKVFAIGSRENTFEVAREYGATYCIDYHDPNYLDKIIELNGGKQVDAVALCGGNPAELAKAVHLVKQGGVVSNIVAWFNDEEVSIKIEDLVFGYGSKQINVVQATGGSLRLGRLLSMIECGRFDPAKVITNKFHGKDKVPEAMELFTSHNRNFIKPIVYWE